MSDTPTLIPVAFAIPSRILEMATNAPFNKNDKASKIRLLLNHFFENNLLPKDMSNYAPIVNDTNFTLRLPENELQTLDDYCRRTLYTRQQVLKIAICTSLDDLSQI